MKTEKKLVAKLKKFGLDCASHTIKNWNNKFPLDTRPSECLTIFYRYIENGISRNGLEEKLNNCINARNKPKITFLVKVFSLFDDYYQSIFSIPDSCAGYALDAVIYASRACFSDDLKEIIDLIKTISHCCTESEWHNGNCIGEFYWQKTLFNNSFSAFEKKLIRTKLPIDNLQNGVL